MNNGNSFLKKQNQQVLVSFLNISLLPDFLFLSLKRISFYIGSGITIALSTHVDIKNKSRLRLRDEEKILCETKYFCCPHRQSKRVHPDGVDHGCRRFKYFNVNGLD